MHFMFNQYVLNNLLAKFNHSAVYIEEQTCFSLNNRLTS